MELKDFIGKVVIDPRTKERYILVQITAPVIEVATVQPNERGNHLRYSYPTINGDPISDGSLVFEDARLTPLFNQVYDAYCRTEDAFWEEYGYWLRRE